MGSEQTARRVGSSTFRRAVRLIDSLVKIVDAYDPYIKRVLRYKDGIKVEWESQNDRISLHYQRYAHVP